VNIRTEIIVRNSCKLWEKGKSQTSEHGTLTKTMFDGMWDAVFLIYTPGKNKFSSIFWRYCYQKKIFF
jgi:hypothetical protein